MNPLKEGSRVPSVTFRTRKDGDWRNLTSDEICAGKAVVVFSLPGAVFVNGQHIGGLDELRDWAKKAA